MSESATAVDDVRIASIVLRSPDPDALARFYRDALDFTDDGADRDTRRLVCGGTRLAIEPTAPGASPYPGDVPGWSPLFQHCAIRVCDIDRAMARLAVVDGWRAISTAGPERLPLNTGGVTAFKFRDPDGHPLELIAFPDRRDGPLFHGIDHTAISVADIARSIAFYERLGFVVDGRSLNVGVEQERLDGLVGATVDIVGLRTPSRSTPHLELLGYRGTFDRAGVVRAEAGDVAATRIVIDGGPRPSSDRTLRDPDGHLVESIASSG